MPEFRHANSVEVEASDRGWALATLADRRHVPGLPMMARRWQLGPRGSTPEQPGREGVERFLYVISGEGRVKARDQVFDVAREDVLWLEPADHFELAAGERGLQVLEAISG